LFRRFINGLSDKGEKVKNFRTQIEFELNKRQSTNQLCKDMALMNIGKDQLNNLEWSGKHVPFMAHKDSQPHIDDGNILKMFISHSGVNQEKIIVKYTSFNLFMI